MIGDHVQCVYHGLEFDAGGRCMKNPQSGGRIVDGLHVRAFPLVERDGLVRIWMGEAERAEAARIPDFSHLQGSGRRTIKGTAWVACRYRFLIDNLMDLGHVQFLHGPRASRVMPASTTSAPTSSPRPRPRQRMTSSPRRAISRATTRNATTSSAAGSSAR